MNEVAGFPSKNSCVQFDPLLTSIQNWKSLAIVVLDISTVENDFEKNIPISKVRSENTNK